MAHREDLRQVVGVARERVVGRRRPVLGQPHELAEVVPGVLRVAAGVGEDVGPADGHVERAVGAPTDARRRDAAVEPLGHEDVPHLGQRPGVEAPAGEGHGHPFLAVADDRLAVGQVDEPVVVGMHRHVHEPGAVRLGEDLGHAGDVALEELPVAHHPQGAAVALRDEDVAVAAERHAPGVREPGGDRHHPDARHLGGVQHARRGRRGHRRHPVPALGGRGRGGEDDGQAEREQGAAAGAAMAHGSSLDPVNLSHPGAVSTTTPMDRPAAGPTHGSRRGHPRTRDRRPPRSAGRRAPHPRRRWVRSRRSASTAPPGRRSARRRGNRSDAGPSPGRRPGSGRDPSRESCVPQLRILHVAAHESYGPYHCSTTVPVAQT